MPNLTEFFLNASARVAMLETLEISHPDFSKIYRIVRNARLGIVARLEASHDVDPLEYVQFDYYPLRIKRNGSSADLDQSFDITVGDLGDIIQTELRLVEANNGFETKPLVLFRAYRSDDLTAPIIGPIKLEISEIPITEDGFTFTATPYRANISPTGEIYTLERFPGLRGFL